MLRIDAETRGHMVMLTRQGWPLGEALTEALAKTSSKWDSVTPNPLANTSNAMDVDDQGGDGDDSPGGLADSGPRVRSMKVT